MGGLRGLAWGVVLVTVTACGGESGPGTVEVDLVTDYRPGVAFDEVRVRLSVAGGATPFAQDNVPVEATMDFRRGLQVLSAEVTEREVVDVRVSLWLAGELVTSRTVQADLRSQLRLRVVITCPADGLCWPANADGGPPDAGPTPDMGPGLDGGADGGVDGGRDGGVDGGEDGGSSLCPEASDPELRACWRFEDDLLDGTTFENDLAGGASFGGGYNGRGLVVPEAPSLPHDESLAPMGLTITAWVRPEALPEPGSVAVLLEKRGDYEVRITEDGRLYCRVWVGDGTWYNWGTLPGRVPIGEWTHVACTYDGSELLTWDNGRPQGTVVDLPLAQGRTRGALTIGNDEAGTAPFAGTIDDVYIWGYARSESQVRVAAGLTP